MREYLLGILCAALLCSVCAAIGGKQRLIAGAFLALAILKPLGAMELPELSLEPYLRDAEAAVREGEAQAADAKTEFITDALEAYILTKAKEAGLTLQASVTLDESCLPESVELTGEASPGERAALEQTITEQLGLGKGAILWNQSHKSSE